MKQDDCLCCIWVMVLLALLAVLGVCMLHALGMELVIRL